LGFCYSQGLGVKKDLYCSAKYYRLAEKQGQGIIGNSWIWKEKYNQVEEPGWNGQRKK
jgi:TPR repeat protein